MEIAEVDSDAITTIQFSQRWRKVYVVLLQRSQRCKYQKLRLQERLNFQKC